MKTYETLAVNIDKAEFIISLSSRKRDVMSFMTLIRELQDQFQIRQKQNRAFYQVSQVILESYEKKLYAMNQLACRIQSELDQQNEDMEQLTSCRASLNQKLDDYESELTDTREYAEQRRNKKSKREKQYHQLYHVPLVAAQYKKKYVRARDKNSAAENQVSAVREKVDTCQQEITGISKSLADLQRDRESLTLQYRDLDTHIKDDQELVFQVQEGKKFLASFDAHQLVAAQTATTQLAEAVHSNELNEQTIRIFKMALYEYGQAESMMDERWGALEAEFQCSKCNVVQTGWPKPNKLRVDEVLCEPCYQEHHSSMVFEKKITGIKDRSSQLLSLPGGSMLSFSSISTIDSSDSTGGKKKGLKKMMKLFKRSSSSNSFSTS